MLWYAMLCYAMLCYDMLCYDVIYDMLLLLIIGDWSVVWDSGSARHRNYATTHRYQHKIIIYTIIYTIICTLYILLCTYIVRLVVVVVVVICCCCGVLGVSEAYMLIYERQAWKPECLKASWWMPTASSNSIY